MCDFTDEARGRAGDCTCVSRPQFRNVTALPGHEETTRHAHHTGQCVDNGAGLRVKSTVKKDVKKGMEGRECSREKKLKKTLQTNAIQKT